MAGHRDAAAAARQQAQRGEQGGGFAGAIAAQQGINLAGRQCERQAINDAAAAPLHHQPIDGQRRCHQNLYLTDTVAARGWPGCTHNWAKLLV